MPIAVGETHILFRIEVSHLGDTFILPCVLDCIDLWCVRGCMICIYRFIIFVLGCFMLGGSIKKYGIVVGCNETVDSGPGAVIGAAGLLIVRRFYDCCGRVLVLWYRVSVIQPVNTLKINGGYFFFPLIVIFQLAGISPWISFHNPVLQFVCTGYFVIRRDDRSCSLVTM